MTPPKVLQTCASTRISSITPLLFVITVGMVLFANSGRAANLLVNPGFELNSQHAIPSGWARFAPPNAQAFGNYWIETGSIPVPAQAGLQYFKQWGASYNGTNNAAGLIQEFSSNPGSTYQASGWFYTRSGDLLGADCKLWIEVSFLGSSSNLLALFRSDDFSAAAGADTWLQYAVNRACDVSAPVSIGDPYFNTYAVTGTVSQLVAPVGTTKVRYRFVYMQFASQGGSAHFDSAILDQVSGPIPPLISNLFPLNMIFVNPADGITCNVSSPSGFTINGSSIGLVVNGVNVSGNLNITGSASSKSVSYLGLQSNLTYNVSITVTDSFNLTASASTFFETTWVGVPPVLYQWEAEDFDFTNGMYFNHPTFCNTPGSPNCYFGKVGVEGVDEHVTGSAPNHVYRPDDPVGTLISGDYSRKGQALAGVFDYRIDPFNTDMWLNYTRDWTNGTYWVIGRLSTDVGLSGFLTLSLVNPDTTTTDLGRFRINGGRGWSTFDNVYLQDTNGNNALVTLNGKQTLRVTSGGNLLPNFFMLVAAQADLPQLSNVYPTGTHPFEYTNALSFTVTTMGSSFPANGIRLNLNGYDVSSNLIITGSTSTKNVVYPTLLPNAIHTAIISVTNVLGNGISVTNRFDTFSEANYMVDAENFDYDGGQYIDPATDPNPNAYFQLGATTNIDFQHITLSGEFFTYRSDGIPQDYLNLPVYRDWVRSNFVEWGAIDYVLTYFAGTDWANYTRQYPAGSYLAYIRTSGDGPFSMYLDQVVSGAGTVNQVTRRLGRFGAVGKDYITYAWVPLTDDGLSAPAIVKLNGLTTLRLVTDGNCNPNFFMLVPAGGITLTAARSAGQFVLSFPTQPGVNYRVFYRTNLASGNWTFLTGVLGNGAVRTVNDLPTEGSRFYKVTAP